MANPKLAFALKAVNEASPTLNQVGGDMDRLGDKADAAGGRAGKLGGILGGALKVGAMAAVAGIAAAGFAVLKFGGEFDRAFDKIRVGTGATGDALAALKDDFKDVLTSVPTNAEDASTAIADLNTRLGLTGEPLRDLSKQLLEMSRITDTDLGTNVEKVTRLFGDWGVETENQSAALDNVFKASQATGPSVDKLASLMVSFGAPLRSLNFSMEESAALLGKWEKEGVNTELVMGSLKIAIAGFAKEGIDAREGLEQTIAKIQELGPGAEATGLAMKTFGARAGGDMAAAILEGKFAIDDLVETIAASEETIVGVGEETMSMGEQWTILKNNILVGVQPVLTRLFDLLGTGMKFLRTTAIPAIKALAGIFGASLQGDLQGAHSAFAKLPEPLHAIGQIAFDVGRIFREDIIPAFKDVARFVRDDVVPELREFAEVATAMAEAFAGLLAPALETLTQGFADLKPVFDLLLPPLKAVGEFLLEHKEIMIAVAAVIAAIWVSPILIWVGLLILVLAKWDEIKKMLTQTIPEAIDDVIESVERIPIIGEIFGGTLDAVVLLIKTHFEVIKNFVETTLGAIIDFVQIWLAIFRGDWDQAWTEIKELFTGIFDGMLAHVGIVLGAVLDLFLLFPGRILGVLGDLGTLLLDIGGDIVDGLFRGVKNYWKEILLIWLAGFPGLIWTVLVNTGIRDKLVGLGKDLMAGLLKGITEALNDVLDFVGGIPGKISGVFKSAADIFSPSKMMAAIGEQLMAGLGVGIEEGFDPKVREVLHDVMKILKSDAIGQVKDLAGSLADAWAGLAPSGGGGSGGGGAGGGGGGGSGAGGLFRVSDLFNSLHAGMIGRILGMPDADVSDWSVPSLIWQLNTRFSSLQELVAAVNEFVPELSTGSGNIGAWGGNILPKLRDHGLNFLTGGIVPGPLGAPVQAIVHGGERVLTPEQQGGFHLHIHAPNAFIIDEPGVQKAVDTLWPVLQNRIRTAGA